MKDPQERFWTKVNKTETCWLWTGANNGKGYGKFTAVSGRAPVLTHRFAYESTVGPIPEGLHLDHLCRVRSCVNPAHLEPVTESENRRRGVASKTHCIHGHEYTPENTYRSPSHPTHRECLTCMRMRYTKKEPTRLAVTR